MNPNPIVSDMMVRSVQRDHQRAAEKHLRTRGNRKARAALPGARILAAVFGIVTAKSVARRFRRLVPGNLAPRAR